MAAVGCFRTEFEFDRSPWQIRFFSGVLAGEYSIGLGSQAPRRAFGVLGNAPGRNE